MRDMNEEAGDATKAVTGIHHITAIAGDPQENIDFYIGTLGLRLVKRSINQDAPDTYHLFFADGVGNPGTDITFFPWPSMAPGRRGAGVWGEVGFILPEGSLDWWTDRVSPRGRREVRFGEEVLVADDPHGMVIVLTEAPTAGDHDFSPWSNSSVPEDKQIRGLSSAGVTVRDIEGTAAFLERSFGFHHVATERDRHRFVVGDGGGGQRIDIVVDEDAARGTWGTGSIHHVAFRVPNRTAQDVVDRQITDAGGRSSGVIDRFWFQSVYVREPAGALCEVATDGPGFGVDEEIDHLGETLVLPPWYEEHRDRIEAALPVISVPSVSLPSSDETTGGNEGIAG